MRCDRRSIELHKVVSCRHALRPLHDQVELRGDERHADDDLHCVIEIIVIGYKLEPTPNPAAAVMVGSDRATVRITLAVHPFYDLDLPVWEGPRRWHGRETIGAEFPNGVLKRVPLE